MDITARRQNVRGVSAEQGCTEIAGVGYPEVVDRQGGDLSHVLVLTPDKSY
jgi:hypothetical protein